MSQCLRRLVLQLVVRSRPTEPSLDGRP